MEDLVKDLQQMFKKVRKDDDSDKYLFFSPKYSPTVKISDWFLPREAEPKDSDPYHPPGGNYFQSTYKRLGTDDQVDTVTTTQAMLRQICDIEPDVVRHRHIVNAATERLDEAEDPMTYTSIGPLDDEMHFTTTYEYDYRHPFPYRKQLRCKPKEKPTRRYGLASKFSPSKICEAKYLDDELYNQPGRIEKLDPPTFV